MNINISSLHFKADKKLEDFIEQKIEKLTKVYDNIIGAEVILKIENGEKPENKSVDMRIKIKGYDTLADKTAKTFEEAVDLCIEALKKQLTKVKEKERSRP
ncbi:MAG: ribosome-associated translation inhibitor RaiA [Bacteroidales bacterium]|jgi:putative sigma-54 modulation protein|nr:ribosome-associated translation inhibitor RaiA [Bacteroidales bacterium]